MMAQVEIQIGTVTAAIKSIQLNGLSGEFLFAAFSSF